MQPIIRYYCLGLQLELNEVQLNCDIERGQLNILWYIYNCKMCGCVNLNEVQYVYA